MTSSVSREIAATRIQRAYRKHLGDADRVRVYGAESSISVPRAQVEENARGSTLARACATGVGDALVPTLHADLDRKGMRWLRDALLGNPGRVGRRLPVAEGRALVQRLVAADYLGLEKPLRHLEQGALANLAVCLDASADLPAGRALLEGLLPKLDDASVDRLLPRDLAALADDAHSDVVPDTLRARAVTALHDRLSAIYGFMGLSAPDIARRLATLGARKCVADLEDNVLTPDAVKVAADGWDLALRPRERGYPAPGFYTLREMASRGWLALVAGGLDPNLTLPSQNTLLERCFESGAARNALAIRALLAEGAQVTPSVATAILSGALRTPSIGPSGAISDENKLDLRALAVAVDDAAGEASDEAASRAKAALLDRAGAIFDLCGLTRADLQRRLDVMGASALVDEIERSFFAPAALERASQHGALSGGMRALLTAGLPVDTKLPSGKGLLETLSEKGQACAEGIRALLAFGAALTPAVAGSLLVLGLG